MLHTSPAAYVKNQLNRAIFDTSMKIGIQAQFDEPIILRRRATLDFARGCHGNRFCIILSPVQYYSFQPISIEMTPF